MRVRHVWCATVALAMLGIALEAAAGEAPAAGTAAAGKESVRRGVEWLLKNQKPDGSWGKYDANVGQTALVVWTLAAGPMQLREKNCPQVAKAVEFMLKNQQADGSIVVKGQGLENYNTSIAILALIAVENPKYKDVISKARNYVAGIQVDERSGSSKDDPKYGGIGYGSSKEKGPDLSNTHMALEALKAAGLSADDPAFKRALVFVKRCQNQGETNDRSWAGVVNDGGGVYRPEGDDISKSGKVVRRGKEGWRSYGSMTYAMMLGFVYCSAGADSPEMKGALDWIRSNYSVDENPGIGSQGLYYYYHTFAKALRAAGIHEITDSNGKKHDWAQELIAKLASLQKEDGSWANPADRWFEGDPALVTAYAVRALSMAVEELETRQDKAADSAVKGAL